ncbi:hypothetical protein LIP_0822 [Limnochorda pilosa]|uniref:Uncharacterized protein n=1 Tax=Limnochorda pilosa TaxID=1555112 RepID=A0A0K2SIN6_LIMPI|nr:hypothetical protein LIP_0822 [Limnochorda pilosa]
MRLPRTGALLGRGSAGPSGAPSPREEVNPMASGFFGDRFAFVVFLILILLVLSN